MGIGGGATRLGRTGMEKSDAGFAYQDRDGVLILRA